MRSNAIPLEADMAPLRKVVGDARIVSLGDATRGTHEFFTLRHRILEFLATEMGFTIFAMEANMPEAYLLNEYVQNGTGNPAELLLGTRLWTMDTREMIDLLEWMREFNRSGKGHVEVAGFDMAIPDMAIKNLREFVAASDPAYSGVAGSAEDQAGKASATQVGPNFGYATAAFPASDAAGKRVRFSAYIKTKGVTRGEASIYLRAEGATGAVIFDSTQKRGAKGTADWQRYEVELAVPADARSVTFGAVHNGDGDVWFDSMAFELDGAAHDMPAGLAQGGNRYAVRRDAKESRSGKPSLRMRRLSPEPPKIVDPEYVFGVDRESVDPRTAANTWKQVVEHLEQSRESYRHKCVAEREIAWAIQNARIVMQCMQARSGESARDNSMAANVKWIVDQSKGSKVVLWGHNGHVATGGSGADRMGVFLRKMFGGEMVVFGFAFNHGSFQAQEGKLIKEFTVPPAPLGSLDRTLAATEIPVLALDVRPAPESGPVAQWLMAPHKSRSIGPTYIADRPSLYLVDLIAPKCFDAILFVEKTTAPHKRLRRR